MIFKIHFFTWFLWSIALLNGSFKAMFFLFMMMSIHECSHCLMAVFFHLKVSKVEIYPFGLCASINNLEYQACFVQLSVMCAGIMIHGLIPYLLLTLNHFYNISDPFMNWCLLMNRQIFLFNCLPVYPLDGSRIIQSILFHFFPYKCSKRIVYMTSLIVSLTCMTIIQTFSSALIFMCLITMDCIKIRNLGEEFKLMCCYRLSQPSLLKLKIHHYNDLYMYSHNMFIENDNVIDEKRKCINWMV